MYLSHKSLTVVHGTCRPSGIQIASKSSNLKGVCFEIWAPAYLDHGKMTGSVLVPLSKAYILTVHLMTG